MRRTRNVCHWIILLPLSLTYLHKKKRVLFTLLNFARTTASDALLGPQHPIFECYSDKRQKKKNSRHWHLKVRKKYWLRTFFICAEQIRTWNVRHWIILLPLILTYLPNKKESIAYLIFWTFHFSNCAIPLLNLRTFEQKTKV